MLSRFERHQTASYGAAAVPSKTMCRQTLTTLVGTERHRRFYLAVLIGRKRPNLARLSDILFSFHFSFSAAVEDLRWHLGRGKKHTALIGRYTSRRGVKAGWTARFIAASTASRSRHSAAGSTI